MVRATESVPGSRVLWPALLSMAGCFEAPTPTLAQSAIESGEVRAELTGAGLSLEAPGIRTRLSLRSIGRRGHPPLLAEHAHEWLTTKDGYVEHGFTLDAPPSGVGPVTVQLQVEGASAQLSNRAVVLASAEAELRYGELIAVDAIGNVLPSHMRVEGEGLDLEVDDRGATYPVVIDPTIWVEHGHLGSNFIDTPALALSGQTLVVGRPNEANGDGAVHVYDRVGPVYLESAVVTAPVAGGFGRLVALAGDVLAVSNGAGNVDVLRRHQGNAWTAEAHIDVASAVHHVAVSETTLAIGTLGAVEIYEYDGSSWTVKQSVGPSDPVTPRAVALASGRLFVGVPLDDPLGSPTGAVYVYEPMVGGWSETQRLTASDALQFDSFGTALAAEGDRLVVGSLVADPTGNRGAAYVFERNGGPFLEVAKLSSANPAVTDSFGGSVALRGDVVAVGAPEGDEVAFSGSLSLFERGDGSWPLSQRLQPEIGELAEFGGSAALEPELLFVADHLTGVWMYPVVGLPCDHGASCSTEICSDGVCCEQVCDDQCSACDVPGAIGLCRFVVGPPHPGHEPCDAACVEGVENSAGGCNGSEISCVGIQVTACSPYVCGVTSCLDSCEVDQACQSGYRCDTSIDRCTLATASCDGAHSLLTFEGTLLVDCTPFKCQEDACLNRCASTWDCAAGFVCDASARCIKAPENEAGCDCRMAGGERPDAPLWLALGALGMRRRRLAC